MRSRNDLRVLERAREPGARRAGAGSSRVISRAVELDRARRSAGRTRSIRLTSVDLPAPFGPIRPDDLVLAQLERDVVERLHALERARDGERPQDSLRRGAVGGAQAGSLVSARARGGPGRCPGPPADRASCRRQTFGTTFAVTEPTTFALLPAMRDHAVLPAEHACAASARS